MLLVHYAHNYMCTCTLETDAYRFIPGVGTILYVYIHVHVYMCTFITAFTKQDLSRLNWNTKLTIYISDTCTCTSDKKSVLHAALIRLTALSFETRNHHCKCTQTHTRYEICHIIKWQYSIHKQEIISRMRTEEEKVMPEAWLQGAHHAHDRGTIVKLRLQPFVLQPSFSRYNDIPFNTTHNSGSFSLYSYIIIINKQPLSKEKIELT